MRNSIYWSGRRSTLAVALALAGLTFGCQRDTGADDGARVPPPRSELPDRAPPPAVAVAPRPDAAAQAEEAGQLRSAAEALPRTVARAALEPTAGNDVRGTVEFAENGNSVTLDVMLSGLTPGPHGLHVHEFGDCSAADASSAGKHLNPHESKHGAPTDARDARHPGDLGNVVADQMGNVRTSLHDTVLGSEPDFQMVGHALVVHAGEDDLASQPSGNSGDPVACGVIEAAPAGAARPAPG
ncbi:MAG TPA: superoxide dismutase family protein [Gammaproteobacteria bacterium]|nr:superoxide dismutase family protein [Gammaproteobacteria bacterium]